MNLFFGVPPEAPSEILFGYSGFFFPKVYSGIILDAPDGNSQQVFFLGNSFLELLELPELFSCVNSSSLNFFFKSSFKRSSNNFIKNSLSCFEWNLPGGSFKLKFDFRFTNNKD